MPNVTEPIAKLIELLERLEPQSLDEATTLPALRGASDDDVRRAWDVYHHNRGRGWN